MTRSTFLVRQWQEVHFLVSQWQEVHFLVRQCQEVHSWSANDKKYISWSANDKKYISWSANDKKYISSMILIPCLNETKLSHLTKWQVYRGKWLSFRQVIMIWLSLRGEQGKCHKLKLFTCYISQACCITDSIIHPKKYSAHHVHLSYIKALHFTFIQ